MVCNDNNGKFNLLTYSRTGSIAAAKSGPRDSNREVIMIFCIRTRRILLPFSGQRVLLVGGWMEFLLFRLTLEGVKIINLAI